MDPAGVAGLVTALTMTAGVAIGGVRKWMQERDQKSYERARADITAEEAKRSLETKNRELTLINDENAQLRELNDRLTRTIERITGASS